MTLPVSGKPIEFFSRLPADAVLDVPVSPHLAIEHILAPIPDTNEHERAGLRLWCARAAARAHAREVARYGAIGTKRNGMTLTADGWLIPNGPLNPRIFDQDPPQPTPAEIEEERLVQRYVDGFRHAHEHATRVGDLRNFLTMYRTWELPIDFYFEPVNDGDRSAS